ncbi:hypothetical protein KFV02_04005 [Desulfohalobiaceae bacterium Ax17]|uniref:hypothetical protein n=1 Tax=Desulfovulcanus ferrireducens TaxID=2831190 RepID=UPI00207BB924|nr:hypothetical protein [Desulfovulcanus ferrireducens]MBT8763090.1 hypothetical protein [Desulfovulcanus ferrireducens]
MNRPVRTRTQGGVGAGGERPPATRLDAFYFTLLHLINSIYQIMEVLAGQVL